MNSERRWAGRFVVLVLSVVGVGCGAADVADTDDANGNLGRVAQAACSEFDVFMAPGPTGSDANSGLSAGQPVEHLSKVQSVIRNRNPTCPTVVKVALGTYSQQSVVWTYVPNFEIKFEPADGYASRVRPVFDGCPSGSGCPTDLTWFDVTAAGSTKLNFRYLRVQRYLTAISLDGNRDVEADSVRDNQIYGMWFQYIGNGWAGGEGNSPSTAAVRFVNADNNALENSHFYDVTNHSSLGNLHAVYIAHSSDNNLVARNVFEGVSGDPIRVRDYSYLNVIDGNRITRAGAAAYSEWFCDSANRSGCTKPDECWSWENTFSNNTLDGTYSCESLSTFRYEQTNVPANCTRPPRGAVRLHTFGNASTGTPCSL